MKLRADIRIQRKDLALLYEWLDNNAPGWVAWGSATSGELSEERTRQIVIANLEFMERMVSAGNGSKWSIIQVVLPNAQAAMLCKLAWIHADVEKPLQVAEPYPCSD